MTGTSDSPIAPVLGAVREALAATAAGRDAEMRTLRIAVGLSGGRDSVALLDALALVAAEFGAVLSAAHVNHGLSAHADAWAAFCDGECSNRGIPLTIHRVAIDRSRGESPEAAARAARYAALARVDADVLALAHHADDQAETLLLQLMRGAGPHGLAAMAMHQAQRDGPPLLRPFLRLPRVAIDAYVAARGLAWVDDESNADTGVRRNFVRHDIAPRLASTFPGYPATLARAAAHQAEAARLVDELAALDARVALTQSGTQGATLDRGELAALASRAPHRARNLLRWFLRLHQLAAPSTARLAEMLDQLANAAADARVRQRHDGAEIGIHRGQVVVHAPSVAPFAIAWRGERRLALPHGTLEFVPCTGAGVTHAALATLAVTVRTRAGGERIQLAGDRPRRALARVLQEAGMPSWQRESLPLVFCGDALAVVPGIGVDMAFRAPAGARGCTLDWHPDGRGRRGQEPPRDTAGKG